MATRFVPIDRDTPLLLPPNLRNWVPANHLVRFMWMRLPHWICARSKSTRGAPAGRGLKLAGPVEQPRREQAQK
jgi:hypothetical protein